MKANNEREKQIKHKWEVLDKMKGKNLIEKPDQEKVKKSTARAAVKEP